MGSAARSTADADQYSEKSRKVPSHLTPGPIALSWSFAFGTLALQGLLTDQAQLNQDAAWIFGGVSADPSAQHLALYAMLWLSSMSTSFFAMQSTFPAEQTAADAQGQTSALRVPHRKPNMSQHPLAFVDFSYIALNSLCMPGLFYHFFCLMRAWGFDPSQPPLFGVYPPSAGELLTQTLPQGACALALYFATYEFIYYWWHRAMHEVPALYKWVHRHHHQQTYPDRAAIDTLNTGCVESQVGLYLQLAVLWVFGELGLGNLPAGIWFFTIAGWLSVLEHDQFERSLPLGLWEAREHHMHHAAVKCNYSPYSTLWDRLFGTHTPFAVQRRPAAPIEGTATTTTTAAAAAATTTAMTATTAATKAVAYRSSRATRVPTTTGAEEAMAAAARRLADLSRMSEAIWKRHHLRDPSADAAAAPAPGAPPALVRSHVSMTAAAMSEGDGEVEGGGAAHLGDGAGASGGHNPDRTRPPLSQSADDRGKSKPTGRFLGYCETTDDLCLLQDQIAEGQIPGGEELVRMRGIATGYVSIIATAIFAAAVFERAAM